MRSSRRTSRCATCDGRRTGSTPAMRRGTGSTATPSGTGRAARFASARRSGCGTPLDTAAMERAGSVFIGRHDFRTFGVAGRTSVRTVMAVRVRREGRLVTIDVRADAFLRGMVRRMVAVLLEVGLGTMDETAVRAALAGPGPALDGASAPAKGLCLRRVAIGRAAGRTERRTRGTMNAKTYSVREGEIDATLVRRRRDGRDARPPRLAHRARPRGQAQADLPAQPRLGRPRDRPQRRRASR